MKIEDEIDLAKIDEEIEAMARKSAENNTLMANTAFEEGDSFLSEADLVFDEDEVGAPLAIAEAGESEKTISTSRSARINFIFSEVLFKYYMMDKSFTQIQDMYRGTEYEFSMMMIQYAAKRFKWKERKERILAKVEKSTNRSIEHFVKDKIDMVNFLMTVTIDEMDKDYRKYILEGGKKPAWIPTTVKDIDTLARLQDFVLSGGVNKHAVKTDTTNNIINTAFIVDDSNALSILKALTDPKELDQQYDENTIEAEIVGISEQITADSLKKPKKK